MAKALMIQGTCSGAGKSVVVAGLCRIFTDMGLNVAPFKAQNMALNSFITKEGGEIGRAQAFQAQAACIEPCNDMNPILLKAANPSGCQVILNGKVHSNMKASEYYSFKAEAWNAVTSAYDRLSKKYDVIVIEGAGSPAEINLQEQEVVNMSVARYANAPVVLVGDIDKGGVFASFYGTVELLKDGSKSSNCSKIGKLCDADYIKAFIVNKFRGDMDILRPGLRMIEDKTGKLVIGVLPYVRDINLPEEDGLALYKGSGVRGQGSGKIRIVVARLNYISNFTDFDPFMYEPDVELNYSLREEDFNNADLIIIPGSKNTVNDLLLLRQTGVEESIKRAAQKSIPVAGICGGYQMLGRKIIDPFGIESGYKEVEGLGLLDIETVLEKTKVTSQVEAELVSSLSLFNVVQNSSNCDFKNIKGYEIHMGVSTGDIGLLRFSRLTPYDSHFTVVMDGSQKGNVWGTYLHGIFDNDNFRTALLNSLRMKKGLPAKGEAINYSACREDAIKKWADVLRKSVDICFILRLLNLDAKCCKEYQMQGEL
ncbi:MAG: cobyric acid synthase [Nitrospirae bacterium]|nr:cobyric acid synthase [Nitrospirota bacterium]